MQDFRSVQRGDLVRIGPLYAQDFREFHYTMRVEHRWHPEGRGVGWIAGPVVDLQTKDGKPLGRGEPAVGRLHEATDLLACRARILGRSG
ncbi:MAG: hypothetical protein QOH92_588 [Chloroflexota bacterium]|nr:hypothetical protein [Chloroflexota bacterium]